MRTDEGPAGDGSTKRVVVVDHDPRWAETFEMLRARIWPVVEGVATAIEHVGSTSVPGL
ncbi:MAG: GrpB family protein, partial [Acidimicrobiia bacterium]